MTTPAESHPQSEDIDAELKRAELDLRRQQLAIQRDSHDRGKWANPLLIAVLAAFLAAIANLGVTLLTAANSEKMEQRKWELARLDERTKNTSIAVSEFARQLASGYQEASWVLWKRINDPAHYTARDAATYDRAMKKILPAVLASHVQIATLDPSLYSRFTPLVLDLTQVDEKVATLLAGAPARGNMKLMRAVHSEAGKLLGALGQRIATVYIEEQPQDARILTHYREIKDGRSAPSRSSEGSR